MEIFSIAKLIRNHVFILSEEFVKIFENAQTHIHENCLNVQKIIKNNS